MGASGVLRIITAVSLCLLILFFLFQRLFLTTPEAPPVPVAPAHDTLSPENEPVIIQWEKQADEISSLVNSPVTSRHTVLDASTGTPLDAATDDEWATLPRKKWQVAALIMASPDTLDARELFRHLRLNPRDTYIAKPRRKELETWLEPILPVFAWSIEAIGTVTQNELGSLIRSGRLTPLRLLEDEESRKRVQRLLTEEETRRRQWAQRGVEYIAPVLGVNWTPGSKALYEGGASVQSWQIVDGRFYGATRLQLGQASQLWVQRDALSQQLLARIVYWFVESGALSSQETEELLRPSVALTEDITRPR